MINKICRERHDKLFEKLDLHEKRLDKLERDDAVSSTKITEMISIINSLVAIWVVVVSMGGTVLIILLGYVVQHVFGK